VSRSNSAQMISGLSRPVLTRATHRSRNARCTGSNTYSTDRLPGVTVCACSMARAAASANRCCRVCATAHWPTTDTASDTPATRGSPRARPHDHGSSRPAMLPRPSLSPPAPVLRSAGPASVRLSRSEAGFDTRLAGVVSARRRWLFPLRQPASHSGSYHGGEPRDRRGPILLGKIPAVLTLPRRRCSSVKPTARSAARPTGRLALLARSIAGGCPRPAPEGPNQK
jgi:hypothetical protein